MSPVFLSLLCAHALCSVLSALCLSGFLVTAREAPSTKHEHAGDKGNKTKTKEDREEIVSLKQGIKLLSGT
jgi:hypothetical protein